MTSKQVMLTVAALRAFTAVVVALSGCAKPAEPLVSPYVQRHVWAVAPLLNQSGTLQADGAVLADHLARQLENAANLDVLAVNRTIAAMDALQLTNVSSPDEAAKVLETLGADGLIVGVVTSYDPYDPPKLGLALELYVSRQVIERQGPIDLRDLTRAATQQQAGPAAPLTPTRPAAVVSGFFDAGDPGVREQLKRYAVERGSVNGDDESWRLFRINMDLYSEFVSYVMSWRLLNAETQRLASLNTPPAR